MNPEHIYQQWESRKGQQQNETTLEDRIDWFIRHGAAHVPETEIDPFIRAVAAKGLGYGATWDNGLRSYYVEKREAVNLESNDNQ